jgi:hypothetical protein
MDYDLGSNLLAVPAIAQGTYTSTQTSSALDTSSYNYKSLTAVIGVGIGGITFDAGDAIKFQVTTSPDNNSDYVAATSSDVIVDYTSSLIPLPDSNGTVLQFTALHAAAAVYVVSIITKARYVKIAATFSGTHGSGTPIHVDWLFGNPMSAPSWQTEVTPDVI